MSRLISPYVLDYNRKNLSKNDCPTDCDKTHCTKCQFRSDPKPIPIVKTAIPSPEYFGKDLY